VAVEGEVVTVPPWVLTAVLSFIADAGETVSSKYTRGAFKNPPLCNAQNEKKKVEKSKLY
jgi:hypothetical protein